MTPPPGYLHENAVSRLIELLSEYFLESGNKGKGKLYVPRAGIWRTPHTWLEPDLFYVSAETQARLEPHYRTTADLVIQVISPGSAIYDRNTKADTYAALGVKELWLIDEASGIIEVRILEGDRYAPSVVLERDDQLRSVVLSGFEVRVGNVFGV